MVPWSFPGTDTQNLPEWIEEINNHFDNQNTPEPEKVRIARNFLGGDVRACIDRLAVLLEYFLEHPWNWNWPRLRTAIQKMHIQIRHYQEERRKAILKCVGIGIGVAATIALPFAFLGVIRAMGFGAGGVVAGSTAAAIQSSIGAVEAGSLFAFCQSAAAGGAALATVLETGAIASAAAATIGSKAVLEEIGKKRPSATWKDRENFGPSPAVIVAVSQVPDPHI